ncbi:MAG TPA: PKD domain-containing protein [Verrucomicrobiae bacterium]|nr:PKD domain-containing protein [Verrucomicrobiae bacterium]
MLSPATNGAIAIRLLCVTIAAKVFCLAVPPAAAQSNVVVRVMGANLTSGSNQRYETPGLDIFKGLAPDIVAIQEFHYASTTTNGVDTPAAFREMIDSTFGTNYVYFRESGYDSGLPNGIISRYPIIASGSWDDPVVNNRGFAWTQIDLPGTNDLYVVSVHLYSGGTADDRNTEALTIKSQIQNTFPSNAWVIVAGDMNTDSRSEGAITTFTTFLSDSPIPTDAESGGNPNTSANRNKPYDYVLPSLAMTNILKAVGLPSHSFSNGLVFDSRVYTPLTDVPPVQSGDSGAANMQHMGVVKDFLVPSLASGALLVVTPANDLSGSGMTGGPFNPSSQIYTLGNSGNSNLDWSVTHTSSWVTISPTNGTLAAGTATNVTVSINATANSLSVGNYADTVLFTNTTDGAGTTTRSVNLTVNPTFPVIVANGWTLTAEDCTPTNGAVDPSEVVTVSLSLKNAGTADTTNLVATLQASGDVTSPSNPQTYGAVATNGTPVSLSFSFTASGACGGVITATLQLLDGSANLGTISYAIPLGVTAGIFTQNFDSITAPALPAGWTTSASGAQSNWVTSTTTADTAPNAASSSDSGDIGVNELDSPSIPINSGSAQLTFRHNYGLTASAINSATGYDGGVLEIKIGSGSYTDIVTAGGSFVSGGYDTTLSADYGNPLAGRQAWSGNSGGFTTTVVNLPAVAAGQNIQLRWRCATGSTPAPVSSSGTLAYWTFDGSTPQPALVMTNIAASPVTTSNTGAIQYFNGNPSSGQAIATTGFQTSTGPPTTNTSCFTFTLVVTNGSQATLSNISFDDQRSGTGPANFSVHISQTANFSSVIYDSGQQTSHTSIASGANSFALSLSNLTGTIYFRLYGYSAGASGGTWRIDNLTVQGTVTSGGTVGGSGWYVDSISIQDAFCCTNAANSPVADFTGSPTIGTAPLIVTFADTSTGTISNRFWDFGDGGTTNITTNSVVHPYAAGTYDVALIVSGPDGVSTNTKASYITVLTPFESWQIQYFGSTNNPAAAGAVDTDGDGQVNMAEFLTGTDPTNSVSALRITSIVTQGTNVFVSWTMGPGKTNVLQATSGDPNGSYSTNGFTDIVIITNTVGTVTNGVDVGGASATATRYYRVRLVP